MAGDEPEEHMLAIKGIYDGKVAKPLEKVAVPANVRVLITFLEGSDDVPAPAAKSRSVRSLAGRWQGTPLLRPAQGGFEGPHPGHAQRAGTRPGE